MKALAKLTRPSPEGIFPRKRLFRRLNQARTRPVIFITAPPGSGKTSLVTSYLKDRKLPCLWYQVDASDADVASFFYHMGEEGSPIFSRRMCRLFLRHRIAGDYVTNEPLELRYGENRCVEYLVCLFEILVPCYEVGGSP